MPFYVVKVGTLKHDRKSFPAGATVELTEEQAAALPPGIVEAVPDEKPTKAGK